MKFRTGFVSNSSSSSFVVYGWRFNGDELVELFKKIEPLVNERFEGKVTYENNEDWLLKDILDNKYGQNINQHITVFDESDEFDVDKNYLVGIFHEYSFNKDDIESSDAVLQNISELLDIDTPPIFHIKYVEDR